MTKTTGRLKATWPEALARLPPGFKKAHAMAKAAQDWELKTMALAQTIGAEQARKLVEDAESLSVSTCMSRGQALDVLVQATAPVPEDIDVILKRVNARIEYMDKAKDRYYDETGVSRPVQKPAKPQPFRMTLGPAGEVITQGGEW